jgi:hypothetical protein
VPGKEGEMPSPDDRSPNVKAWQAAIAIPVATAIIITAVVLNYHVSGPKVNPDSESYAASDLEYYAMGAAELIVKGRLKAPATARFTETSVVRQSGDRYLVATTVDAENSFGAMIRSTYLVAVRINPNKATEYTYSPHDAILPCSGRSPTSEEIEKAKRANDW